MEKTNGILNAIIVVGPGTRLDEKINFEHCTFLLKEGIAVISLEAAISHKNCSFQKFSTELFIVTPLDNGSAMINKQDIEK